MNQNYKLDELLNDDDTVRYPVALVVLVEWDACDSDKQKPKRFDKPIRSEIIAKDGNEYIVSIPLFIRMTKEELKEKHGIGGEFLDYCAEYFKGKNE